MPKIVTHLIIGLGLGGAETMLYQLLLHRSGKETEHRVISLGMGSHYEQPIKDLGVDLTVLPIKRKPLSAYRRLKKLVKESDTLCCWMYHANFIGERAFKKERKKGKKLIWNIRHSNLDKKNNSRLTLFLNKLCAKRSAHVDVIAYNGDEARRVHEAAGYAKERGVVLDNGCDLERFAPVVGAKEKLQAELGIPHDKRIVISVAKDAPIKDLPTFISAFGRVKNALPDVVSVMCGKGVTAGNERLKELWNAAGLIVGKDVFPLGLRLDVPDLLSASDLYVLHSAGEAFPNTLIQAMACECLCVSTDVGDARRILDDDLLVATPGDPEELARLMIYALELPAAERGEKAGRNRRTVKERFDIHKIYSGYEALY